jgi:hypothetical protein
VKLLRQIIVEKDGAKFVFKPVTLGAVLDLGAGTPPSEMIARFLDFLVSWEGVEDESGKAIPCSKDAFLNMMPIGQATEIIKEFTAKSGLSADFEKNLPGSSSESES